MKVLFSTDKLNRGGKEKQLLLIAEGLLKRHHDVLVLSKEKVDHNNFYTEIGVPVDRIYAYREGNNYGMRKRYVNKVLDFQPDVMLNFDIMASLWTEQFSRALKKIPTINCTIRGGTPSISRKSRWLSKLCLRKSKYIVANSKAGLAMSNIDQNEYHRVIYNGIDLDYYQNVQPISKEKLLGKKLPADAYIIANVSNLYQYKGQQTLIEAIAKSNNKNIYLIIIGEGPERARLQSKIDQQGLTKRVKLLGRQSNVEQYLKSADLYVHPSWSEGCSNSILEAMACQLPMVTTREGGTAEIVHTPTSRFFKKNDANDLSAAIDEMMGIHSIKKDGLAAWVKQFEQSNMVDQYEAFIKKIALNGK